MVYVDVPPLEAVFIELFSEKGLISFSLHYYFFSLSLTVNFFLSYPLAVWTLVNIISSVGSIDCAVVGLPSRV